MSKQKTSAHKTPGLTSRSSGLMALEQRFMFDGAAVADAVQTLTTDSDATLAMPVTLAQAERQAQQKIEQFLQTATDQQVFDLLSGNKSAPDAAWSERLAELREMLSQGEAPVQVLMMEKASQFNAVAAFAANGPDGKPTIFVNPYWAGLLGNEDMVGVIVEELGHWMDSVLNPGSDTDGDEGQRLADAVMGKETLSTRADADADSGWVQVDGVNYEVEFASFNFTTAYRLAPESPRYEAEKEQESDRFYGQSLGVASINDNTSQGTFSGNDVVVELTIAGTTYHGWISRPIKDQGIVRGFYFWYDPQFTSFAAATSDGNQDGDSNAADNLGFILVVDQGWFSSVTSGTPVYNNGSVNANVYEVGSSSDRVDSALNSVLPVNAAPQANTDTSNVGLTAGTSNGPAREAGGASNGTAGANAIGNVLGNDTDSNGDTLKVTALGVNSASSSVTSSSTSASNGTSVTGLYGTLTIGADGSYSYVVNNSNTAVQALRLTTNTLTDSFTYSIADPSGLSSSAKINIIIQGANDNPIAANDFNTAKESLLADTNANQYTAADPLGYKATGNVLTNDTDVDANSETKAISGASISGSAIGTTSGAGASVTSLSFSSLPGNVSVGYYVFLDGDNTVDGNSTGGTLTALMNGGNQLTVASIDSTSKTFTLSGAVTNVSLSSASILGFSNKTNGTGAYKDTAISTAPTTSSTTNVTLSGTITGTIAAGMTETSTGAQVASVTYDSVTGKATAITLQGAYTFTGQALNFTGSASADETLTGQYGVLLLNADGSYEYTPTDNNSAIGAGQS